MNFTINYLSTGCFLYPAEKSCLVKQKWSINEEEVKSMSNHYEWWSKAGGGPGYKSDIPREEYIKNFNWLKNKFVAVFGVATINFLSTSI